MKNSTYTVQIRVPQGVEPGMYPSDLVLTISGQEFYRPFGIVTDTASQERGPMTDNRWWRQPSGKPVDRGTQSYLDSLVDISYPVYEE